MSAPPIDVRFEIRLNAEGVGWTRRVYDQIYSGEGIRQLDSFYRWLLELLQPQAGCRLLDIATGEGVLPRMGAQRYGLETYGSDLSLNALQIARDEGQRALCVASGESIPFADASFDYVTCIGSLEHFLNMRAGVREMVRVLRPHGTACILVPNTYSIIGNVYKALKTGMSTIDPQPLQRYAARGEWAMLLEECGMRIVNTLKYERETPYSLADWWWYLRHPRALVRLALTPFIPLNWASCFVYLCQPAKEANQ
jgi:ubiquinone/menaquinone biosynthesis C-methylase UbiE